MNPPEKLSERARERVERLLEARREQKGLVTDHPEWYDQCEADEPQEYPGGWQVRVRTWRHWSGAKVDFDADSGVVLHRCVDRLCDPPTKVELSEEEALDVAAGLISIPRDAELLSFRHEDYASGRRVARLEWVHVHQGMRVDGDYCWVQIHPQTHRLVAFGRKWRTVQLK